MEVMHICGECVVEEAVRKQDANEMYEGVGFGGFEVAETAELKNLTVKVAVLSELGKVGVFPGEVGRDAESGAVAVGCGAVQDVFGELDFAERKFTCAALPGECRIGGILQNNVPQDLVHNIVQGAVEAERKFTCAALPGDFREPILRHDGLDTEFACMIDGILQDKVPQDLFRNILQCAWAFAAGMAGAELHGEMLEFKRERIEM